ncbi:hypothetical protein [Candidatus Mesenet endosymbiont of Phosphuga atrata]|uniref:hypothetical protein n=1 Tax=Candidatus Mesenet endosymbiont of Phosphuga atrata TaxID=3066221 RepID=UPI0030D0D6FC
MVLYIGGKSYSNESDLLGAVKNLPSPLLDVVTDFDDKIYTMRQDEDRPDFLISNQQNGDFKNIKGKSDHIFSRENRISDKEAYRINQGNVGFISNGKIGTNDVYDCVALIIQDKKSKKTALAHITTSTNQKFLPNILSYMPVGEKEVIMVGGQYMSGKYNVRYILSVLAKYQYDISIDKSYVCDSRYVHDKSWNFCEACYILNTRCGNVTVDTSNLEISCNFPARSLPKIEGVPYSFSDDLDRLPNLNSCDDVKQYNDDMDNISCSIPNSKLQNTKPTNLEVNTPKIL